MKKILILFMCLVLPCLGGCSTSSNKDFKEYNSDSYVFVSSSGTKFVFYSLEREDATNPKVILNAYLENDSKDTKTAYGMNLSIEERKKDLREFAELVIGFAKKQNWDNDYYLYVDCLYDGTSTCSVVYDYETDTLWIPNIELTYKETYKEMYEKFGTLDKKNLESTEEGIDFLISKGLAYIKHNELEYKTFLKDGYDIFIQDGKFYAYNQDESTAY